jgi:DNA (cytosine-5)-methyltransferase 1
MTIRLNSYFASCGLLEIGLRRAGVTPQQSFEMEQVECATHRLNFEHEVVEGDLTKRLARDEMGCDVAAFTYPCDRFSGIAAIHKRLTGDELYLHAFRRLAINRYEVYLAENVPGMKKFPVVMEAMTSLPGYHVTVFDPVKTELWLPQRRDRLIIIASRRPFAWRPPTRARRRVRLSDILDRDPEVSIPNYVLSRISGAYRDLPIISDPARGDIAPTCVAHYSKDRSTRLVADRRFPHGVRPYTVREYARLQGVPDSFRFAGSDSDAYRMIGNGVSEPVGYWLGKELRRYFGK